MTQLTNLTPFGAIGFPSMARDGRDLALAVTAARYCLPDPTSPPDLPLTLHNEQSNPPLGDIYYGPPQRSSLRTEGQTAFSKPATDIIVSGHARALHDVPVTHLTVRITIGHCTQQALVFGDRVWDVGLVSNILRITPPRPFIAIPLVWERAFGGSIYDNNENLIAYEPRNPVGRGLHQGLAATEGQLLANIEDPNNRIKDPWARPAPVGFAPIARWWQPRVRYAGTYDETWQRDRAPLWPQDFDERFFCAASPALQASPHLQGGEFASIEGLHSRGTMRFRIPAPQMLARFRFNARDFRTKMTLDSVIIDPDAGHLTLIHRASATAAPNISAHRETVIRSLPGAEDSAA